VAQRSRLTLDNSIFIFGYDTVRRELTLCAHSHSLMKKERWTDSHSQGLGGGVLVLPTFASEFGITGTATEVRTTLIWQQIFTPTYTCQFLRSAFGSADHHSDRS
jgi:hypothetical protein